MKLSSLVCAVANLTLCATAFAQTPNATLPNDPITSLRDAHVQGRYTDVVLLADRALLTEPASSGEIHFWRAAALRHLDRAAEALIALDAASRAGFSPPERRLERALALSALGKTQESEQEMEELRRLLQDDQERRREFDERWARREAPSKRFESRIRPQLGYDTNLVAIQDDASLVTDSNRKSFYYGALLTAKFRTLESRAHSLDIEYQGAVRAYSSQSDLSSMDNVLSLVGRTPLSAQVDLELRLSLGEVILSDTGHFRTERSVLPVFLWRPGPGWQLRFWIEWSDADYYDDGPAEQDRDGTRQAAGMEVSMDAGAGWTLTPFFAFRDLTTEGTDYKGQEREVGLRVTMPEFVRVQTLLTLGFVQAPFDNLHSLTTFTEKRSDRRTYLSLTFLFPGLEKMAGFTPIVTIRHENWNSNISEFDFTRWDPTVEFAINLPF